MTQKDDSVYVEHILESINRIAEYVEDDRNKFYQSTLVQDAVIRNLQVLAESSQRLSDEFRSRHIDIPGGSSRDSEIFWCTATWESIWTPSGRLWNGTCRNYTHL